jgi:hypothetical protein
MIWSTIDGYKTYIGLAIGAAAVIANKAGIPMPPGVTLDANQFGVDLWAIMIGAAARHGIAKTE